MTREEVFSFLSDEHVVKKKPFRRTGGSLAAHRHEGQGGSRGVHFVS